MAAVVAATLAIGMLFAVRPAPAEAATVDSNAWYVLVHRNSGKAVEVQAASTAGDVALGGTSGNAWSHCGRQERSNNSAILVAPRASTAAGPIRAVRTPPGAAV
nr:hypothetical protein [Streptomyces flavotricini]